MSSALRPVHETLGAPLSLKSTASVSNVAVSSALPLVVSQIERKSLDNLPGDMQLEIFKYLDWWDVLRARQVCRSLYDISKTRHLWLDLFNRYRGQDMPYTLFVVKKLETHSASDLEELVLGPQKADAAWMRCPPRIRKIPARPGDKPRFLLPGGHWALATTDNAVVCYDLADPSPEPTPVTLVSNPMQLLPGDGSRLVDVATDVDTSTPYLTLNFAVSFFRYNNEMHSRRSVTIQVWRLSSRFDGAGRVVALEPLLLSTFDDNFGSYGIPKRLHICGQYVAYGLGLSLHIVDWTKLNNQSSPFNERQVEYHTFSRILFRNGRILAVDSGTNAALHDVSACSFPPGIYAQPSTVLWRKKILAIIHQGPLGPLPNPDHTADQFLLLTDTDLSILTIPREFDRPDQSDEPTIATICNHPTYRPAIKGIARLRYVGVCLSKQPGTPSLVFRRVRLPHPGRRGSPDVPVVNDSPLEAGDADFRVAALIDDISCNVLMAVSPTNWYLFEPILS